MTRRRFFTAASLLAVALVTLVLHSCGGSSRTGKPVVACSNAVLADFVRTVGGDKADVRTLCGPLDSPHRLASTPELVRAVADSWAVFENGLGLEPWLDGLLKEAKGDHPRFVATRGVPPLLLPDGNPDPHAWLDPRFAITYVENARDMLIHLDPDHETDFRTNADALVDSLKGLDARFNSGIQSIAPERRRLLTVHDSMRYFGARYGFETHALAPLGQDPGEPELKAATDWLNEKRTPAMFAEAGFDEQAIRKLSFSNGRRVRGPLWTETIDAPGKPEGTYRGAMEKNLEEIQLGLR